MTSNTRTHTIQIDGMTGDACVQTVTAALKGVPGVVVKSVNVGSAMFTTEDQAQTQAARTAVGAAGFKIKDYVAPVAKSVAPEAPKPAAVTDASKVIPKTPEVCPAQPALASNR